MSSYYKVQKEKDCKKGKFLIMINLHFHKAEPVPFYVNAVFSLYKCSKCGKVLLVNRHTGYRKWMSKERALYQAYKSETGL